MAHISSEDLHAARGVSMMQDSMHTIKKRDFIACKVSALIFNGILLDRNLSLIQKTRKYAMIVTLPVLSCFIGSEFSSGKMGFAEVQASISSIPSEKGPIHLQQNIGLQDQEQVDPIVLSMPNLSPTETQELHRYMKTLQSDISQLNWGKTSLLKRKSSEAFQESIVDKSLSLYEFYEKNKKIIDKMARFAGKGTLEGVCGSTILVPWILYTSRDVNEAWENIRLLTRINYKHGKNWSIMLENLVAEGVAEKITPHDLLMQSIAPGTILTYDGTQSSGSGTSYGHVEMALTESRLDDGHFYYGKDNTRAGGSASNRINIAQAQKSLTDSQDTNRAKKALGGLIGAYRINPKKSAGRILQILADTDMSSQKKDIPKIVLANYTQK